MTEHEALMAAIEAGSPAAAHLIHDHVIRTGNVLGETLITPPVGMNLYVVQGVRGEAGPFMDVVKGALPFVGIMIAFTGLLISFPGIVTWLPQTMYGN